eukprot:3932144-Rhodomonas_salina.1
MNSFFHEEDPAVMRIDGVVLRNEDGFCGPKIQVFDGSFSNGVEYFRSMISLYKCVGSSSCSSGKGGRRLDNVVFDDMEGRTFLVLEIALDEACQFTLDKCERAKIIGVVSQYILVGDYRELVVYCKSGVEEVGDGEDVCGDISSGPIFRLEILLHLSGFLQWKILALDALKAYFGLGYIHCTSELYSLYEEYCARTRPLGIDCLEELDVLVGARDGKRWICGESVFLDGERKLADWNEGVECPFSCCEGGKNNKKKLDKGRSVLHGKCGSDSGCKKGTFAGYVKEYAVGIVSGRTVYSISAGKQCFASSVWDRCGGVKRGGDGVLDGFGMPSHIGCPRCVALLRGCGLFSECEGDVEKIRMMEGHYREDFTEFERRLRTMTGGLNLREVNLGLDGKSQSVVIAGGFIGKVLAVVHESMNHHFFYKYGDAYALYFRSLLEDANGQSVASWERTMEHNTRIPVGILKRMSDEKVKRREHLKTLFAHTYGRGDVDLWLVGCWTYADALSAVDSLSRQIASFAETSVSNGSIYVSDRALNFRISPQSVYAASKFQINFTLHSSMNALLFSFDHSACCAGYDGKRIFSTPRCVRAFKTGVIYFSPFCMRAGVCGPESGKDKGRDIYCGALSASDFGVDGG